MSFVYPAFLFALSAIAIPIIIHLFHFRRFKTVYFTNVRFLKEVKEETHSRSRIRNLLVLLARCLALIFLVLAFAQPFIPAKNADANLGRRDVSVYIDNSFSMQASSEDVPLLEKAKQRAKEIIQGYAADDRFQVLSTDFEGRDQRLLSRDEALERVGEIKISYSVKELSRVLARQKQALSLGEAPIKDAYVVSDFQKNITDVSDYRDSTLNLSLVPLQAVGTRNVAIDSAWFEAPVQIPNQTNLLLVKVHNYGDTDAENVRVTLKADGQTKPSGNLNIPANGFVVDTVNVTILRTGWHEAEVSITDYPVEFDDHFYFSFNVQERLDVLQIFGGAPNRNVDAAFKSNSYFRCESANAGQLDYSKLPEYELIVLADIPSISSGLASELATYVKNGGNLLVFPAVTADLASYQALCKGLSANVYAPYDQTPRSVSYINYDEFVFKDVFESKRDNIKLPATKSNFKLARSGESREEELLRYRDGSPYLVKNRFERGNVYLCAAPIDPQVNELVQNGEIFVPMLYRMALAKGYYAPISYTIGKDDVLETQHTTANAEKTFKLKSVSGEFIPEQKALGAKMLLTVNNAIREAGFYSLFLNTDEVLDKFSFNYDRRESDLHYLSQAELEKVGGDLANIIDGTQSNDFKEIVGERSRGKSLWKWCVLACLLFLAVETGLLRLWKV